MSIFNKINPIWSQLLEQAKPKEKGNAYLFDKKSSGIYTDILEGIALTNPRNIIAKSYLQEVTRAEIEGDRLYSEGKFGAALDYYTAGYLLADIAGHVAYYRNARKLKQSMSSDKIAELLKLSDKAILFVRDRMAMKRRLTSQRLIQDGHAEIVRKTNDHYSLSFNTPEKFEHIKRIRQLGKPTGTKSVDAPKILSKEETENIAAKMKKHLLEEKKKIKTIRREKDKKSSKVLSEENKEQFSLLPPSETSGSVPETAKEKLQKAVIEGRMKLSSLQTYLGSRLTDTEETKKDKKEYKALAKLIEQQEKEIDNILKFEKQGA